jgi:hypothetical protein
MTAQMLTDTVSIETLVVMLTDGPADTDRCAAAAALGRRGGAEAIDALAQRLRHRVSGPVSQACADALAAIGEPAVPALAQLVAERGSSPYAARALAAMTGPEVAAARGVAAREQVMVKLESVEEGPGHYDDRPRRTRVLVTLAALAVWVALALSGHAGLGWWVLALAGALIAADEISLARRRRRRHAAARRHLGGVDVSQTDAEAAALVEALSHGAPTPGEPSGPPGEQTRGPHRAQPRERSRGRARARPSRLRPTREGSGEATQATAHAVAGPLQPSGGAVDLPPSHSCGSCSVSLPMACSTAPMTSSTGRAPSKWWVSLITVFGTAMTW